MIDFNSFLSGFIVAWGFVLYGFVFMVIGYHIATRLKKEKNEIE